MGRCDWTTQVYEVGGQLISIRLPKMGVSAEICAGLGRDRNCLGVLLVTEPPEYGFFGGKNEAVYSVCAREDEWDFWTGFEVAASRLRHSHISYPLLISALRPLVEAALEGKRDYSNWPVSIPDPASIIPADLKTTVIESPEMLNKPHLSEWNGGAYCTSVWSDVSQPEETSAGGSWGRTRKEAFGRWLHKTHGISEFRTRQHWKGYYATFPQDRKGGHK